MTFEASIAHAHELENINILTKSETKKIIVSLKKLAKLFLSKKFKLTSNMRIAILQLRIT